MDVFSQSQIVPDTIRLSYVKPLENCSAAEEEEEEEEDEDGTYAEEGGTVTEDDDIMDTDE